MMVPGMDNMNHIVKSVLKKEQVMKEVAKYLVENPKTSIESIRISIYVRLRSV